MGWPGQGFALTHPPATRPPHQTLTSGSGHLLPPATPATFRLCPWEHGSSSRPPLRPRPGRPSARWGGGRCHPSEAPTGPGGSPACTPARGRLERYPETHGRGCHVLRSLGEGQRPRPAPRCSSRAGGRYECPAPRWHAASHADGGGDGLLSHSGFTGRTAWVTTSTSGGQNGGPGETTGAWEASRLADLSLLTASPPTSRPARASGPPPALGSTWPSVLPARGPSAGAQSDRPLSSGRPGTGRLGSACGRARGRPQPPASSLDASPSFSDPATCCLPTPLQEPTARPAGRWHAGPGPGGAAAAAAGLLRSQLSLPARGRLAACHRRGRSELCRARRLSGPSSQQRREQSINLPWEALHPPLQTRKNNPTCLSPAPGSEDGPSWVPGAHWRGPAWAPNPPSACGRHGRAGCLHCRRGRLALRAHRGEAC